ncbi:MAG: hypothetical protein J0I65_21600 [Variovorax sp.]|nr:hypothetical protein [Variovorax sp.]|tara:strand:- start:1747 stop:1881 length:135 start_codon:yes stop_codon:yes gene_type:complete
MMVVREAVADRAPEPHEANLFDMNSKYADIISQAQVLTYLGNVS